MNIRRCTIQYASFHAKKIKMIKSEGEGREEGGRKNVKEESEKNGGK